MFSNSPSVSYGRVISGLAFIALIILNTCHITSINTQLTYIILSSYGFTKTSEIIGKITQNQAEKAEEKDG